MEDKIINCQDCGSDFTWSVKEQEFFKDKGYNNEPKRCRQCRRRRKNEAGETPESREEKRQARAVRGMPDFPSPGRR